MQVFSRDLVVVSREHVIGGASSPWRAEPGPLKVVAIDTGTVVVPLNPTQGGVVVAVVKPDVVVQDNDNLRIYQSIKQFQITGGGFEDGMQASRISGALLLCCTRRVNDRQTREDFF